MESAGAEAQNAREGGRKRVRPGPDPARPAVTSTLLAGLWLQLYWLFAELGTTRNDLQSSELFAELVTPGVTIWRAWPCLSFVESGFICGARRRQERQVLLLFVVSTEGIPLGSSVC